jgi:hypothetical protein
LVIVLRGLKTLIALKLLTEKFIVTTIGKSDVLTIIKSKIFHASFKYAFGENMNPKAIIFILISIV